MINNKENDEIEIAEESVPDPFFVAITRARFMIFAVFLVFLLLGLLDFISYWPAIIAVVALAISAVVANWPKDVDKLSPVSVDTQTTTQTSPSRFIEAIPDPIISLNLSGNILLYNESAKKLLPILETDQHISSVIRAPNVLDAIDMIVNGADPIRVSFDLRGDIERNFDVYIASVLNQNLATTAQNAESATLLVLSDLTQQERVESMRADFVANVSHELRTPLASLLGFIETIKGSAKNDKEARDKFLDIMHDQAERMTRLINDLLSLSRIEMNVHQSPSGRVDLKSIIDHVIDALVPVASENNVTINLMVKTEDTLIEGERDELVQVFQNLVENAVKYGGKDKEVDVTISDGEEGHIIVSVRDYGPGIAPENLPRLTERFYRVDVLQSREKGGTGLGLAIVKHILNRHRAQLSIRSTLGEGSDFSINFMRTHI